MKLLVEDIVDDSKPVSSSTITEEKKTAMDKLLSYLAALCSIYDVELRYFSVQHVIGVGED